MKYDVGLLLYTMAYCNPEDHAALTMVKFIVSFWYIFVFCHYGCVFFSMWHPVIHSPCAAAVQLLHYWYTFIFSHLWLYTCTAEFQAAMIVKIYLACTTVSTMWVVCVVLVHAGNDLVLSW